MIFEFFTEDGNFKLDYKDYCNSPELMSKLTDSRRVNLNLGLRQFSFDRQWLEEHPQQKRFVDGVRNEQYENSLRYFLPHCATSDDFNTDSHNFINDASHIYTGMLAGNRFGKSVNACIKALVTFGVIPCDPEWEIFKDHGVTYRPWTGAKEIGVASYNWNNIDETVWPQVFREWIPRKELGRFADYSAPKNTAFAIPLTCGSVINFKCLAQPQGAFESQALDGWVWDEQATLEKFDGANARLRTRRAYSQDEKGYDYLTAGWHVCGATPHKVDGRADTGAGGWFQELYEGTLTKGMSVSFYTGNIIADEPDWVYPEREKKVILKELDEAVQTNNKKSVRAIRSRIYGEFETTGGMVYDEWDDDIHVIDNIEIEPAWSAFRCMDHGRRNPTACLWVATTPNNDYIVFDEYLGADKTISENVAAIVAKSGNTLEKRGSQKFEIGLLDRFQEKMIGDNSQQYIFDVIDGRSFRSPDNNTKMCIGDLYKMAGLNRIKGAPTQTVENTIPILKEMLRVDPNREHIITKAKGAPRLYITRRCKQLIKHIKGYRNKESRTKDGVLSEKPQDGDDHDLDALRYGFMMKPRYTRMKPYKPRHSKGACNGYRIREDKKDGSNGRGRSNVRRDPYCRRG